jgi:Type II secretion system (T2SS), protein F
VIAVIWLSLGLALGGVPGAVAALAVAMARGRRLYVRKPHPMRPILFTLLIEVRAGASVLGALQAAAAAFPAYRDLGRVVRLATVAGLPEAAEASTGPLRVTISQLARGQRSGAGIADTLRGMIDADIAREKAERIARARSLPTRLMIPITLLVLPGLILIFYAPALLRTMVEIGGPLR